MALNFEIFRQRPFNFLPRCKLFPRSGFKDGTQEQNQEKEKGKFCAGCPDSTALICGS